MDGQKFLYVSTCAVNIISFTCGIAFTWASPMIPKLNGNIDPEFNPLGYPINSIEESWIVSLFPLGATIGPFISNFTADKIGRKKTLIVFAVPVVVSFLIASTAYTVICFYISRFLLGLGLGCVFSVVPMYIGEIAEDHNRGALGCIMAVFVTSGSLFTYSIGPYLSVKLFCFLCAVPPIIFIVIFACFIPESPYFLLSVGNKFAAEDSLRRLRNYSKSDLHKELLEITRNVENSFINRRGIMDILKSRGLRRALCISFGLVIFQQISGINIILSYMQTIFSASGNVIPPQVSPVIISIVQVVTCGMTSIIVDKWGRRILLMISAIGACLSEIILGIYFHLKFNNYNVDSLFWLPIFSLILFMITFNIGYGVLPLAILGELFTSDIKSSASTLTVSLCLFLAFVTTVCFPFLDGVLGLANSFWMFSLTLVIAWFFAYFIVPETKGKSLQKIQEILEGK